MGVPGLMGLMGFVGLLGLMGLMGLLEPPRARPPLRPVLAPGPS